MPPLTRRQFMAAVVASAAVTACSSSSTSGPTATSTTTAPELPVPDLTGPPFSLGVASGDPLSDRVILWTRLAPEPLGGGGMPDQPVPVGWEVAADEAFTESVVSGSAIADPALAHSIHVDVEGLEPDTRYWYRFRVGEYQSGAGRTRTLPSPDASPSELRFAFASCQDWKSGYYTAYPHLVADDPDLVLFLGDYIYEYGRSDDAVRDHNSDEIMTLVDYRNRYGQYKGDLDLQAAHAAFPWIVTWDDHEVENNYAGDLDENGSPPEEFLERRAAAYQAYYEHMPMRVDLPDGPDLEIYRSFEWGDLASIFVLDTRQYRDDQICGIEGLGDVADPECEALQAPERQMLGPEQEDWLVAGLREGAATWNVLANQTVFTPMPIGPVVNGDQWDGYPAQRDRLLQVFAEEQVGTPVVVTGDIHASGVGELLSDYDDPDGAEVVGVEFVGTSMTSGGDAIQSVQDVLRAVPWVKYVEASRRGYVLCTVTPEEVRADYRYPFTVVETTSDIETAASFTYRLDDPGARPT